MNNLNYIFSKLMAVAILIPLVAISCKNNKKEAPESTLKETKETVEPDIASNFSIELLDEAAKSIIDPAAKIEILARGFEWTEGPLYIEGGNYLLFSDIPRNKVYKLDAQNDTTTYVQPSGFSKTDFTGSEPGSNGLLLDPKGALILMQHGDRQVAKMNAPLTAPLADYTPLVSAYKGKRLNSPNDGCYDAMGNLYFTDPPYGLPDGMEDAGKELSFQGVYCLLTSGELLLVDTLSRPNGIGLSPDNKTLYVAVSDEKEAVWHKYTLKSPGVMATKELMADVTHLIGKANEDGLPDGLKVNKQGIIFATGPGGIWIFDQQGKAIARIRTGQKTANCAFGIDEKRLFMTADDYILAVDLK